MHQQLDPGYKPDVVILNVGTNDLALMELFPQFFNQAIHQHIQLAKMLTVKFPTASVIVSLPLPRGDHLENLRCQYSHQLQRRLTEINLNVMSLEGFQQNYLSHDLLHPSDDDEEEEEVSPASPASCPEVSPATPASCPAVSPASPASCPEEVSPALYECIMIWQYAILCHRPTASENCRSAL